MKKILGFTLAEVLITLTILGVVAAISVPSIIQNYKKRVTVTKLAKAYSTLEGALNNIAVKTNCIGKDLKCTGLLDISDADEFAKKFSELSGMRMTSNKRIWYDILSLGCYKKSKYSCGGADTNQVRFYEIDKISYYFNKTRYWVQLNKYSYDIKNGISVAVITDDKTQKSISKVATGETPAIRGINVFYFLIYDNFKIEPYYVNGMGYAEPYSKNSADNKTCSIEESTPNDYYGGYGCAGRIIRDGWKIKYY